MPGLPGYFYAAAAFLRTRLAEARRNGDAGYATAIIGKWHLGRGPQHDPAGFDHWVVLPGQGAMPDCMRSLAESGLQEAVIEASRSKPLMGVCVGEQMLFDWSQEGDSKGTNGLGLIPGKVVRFELEGRLQDDG